MKVELPPGKTHSSSDPIILKVGLSWLENANELLMVNADRFLIYIMCPPRLKTMIDGGIIQLWVRLGIHDIL